MQASYTVLPSAARTASINSPAFPGTGARTLTVIIDATDSAATPSVVFTIQRYNPVGNEWIDVLASAAVTGAGNTVLQVGPELLDVANSVENSSVPHSWRVSAVAADADSLTYSIYGELND